MLVYFKFLLKGIFVCKQCIMIKIEANWVHFWKKAFDQVAILLFASSKPATRRPGDQATRRPGDQATRRPGYNLVTLFFV